MGLFIATPSYNGQLTFNVTSSREVMPDIQFFVSRLDKALEELKAAVMPAKKKSTRKKVRSVDRRSKHNGQQPAAG